VERKTAGRLGFRIGFPNFCHCLAQELVSPPKAAVVLTVTSRRRGSEDLDTAASAVRRSDEATRPKGCLINSRAAGYQRAAKVLRNRLLLESGF
jgi:hypothetical protein